MKTQTKIKHAPNTLFIIGDTFQLVKYKKDGSVKKTPLTSEILYHCSKCREQILAVLN